MKKKIVIVLLILIALIAVNLSFATKKIDRLLAEEILTIDLSNIEDGFYLGDYDAGLVKVEIEVEIVNNEIKKINIIKHTNGKGKAGEGVITNILQSQSLKVDTIAGATISSKAIIKAVEAALLN